MDILHQLKQLTGNYILNSALISWFLAQIIKTLLHFGFRKRFEIGRLLGSGGMPSSHSAMVCSLTIAISRSSGVNSPIFALTFVFAAVVMYDAMGVRRAAGEHAKIINKMIDSWDSLSSGQQMDLSDIKRYEGDHEDSGVTDDDIFKNTELKEYIGHTPLEVLGGALLGILVAIIIPK